MPKSEVRSRKSEKTLLRFQTSDLRLQTSALPTGKIHFNPAVFGSSGSGFIGGQRLCVSITLGKQPEFFNSFPYQVFLYSHSTLNRQCLVHTKMVLGIGIPFNGKVQG